MNVDLIGLHRGKYSITSQHADLDEAEIKVLLQPAAQLRVVAELVQLSRIEARRRVVAAIGVLNDETIHHSTSI